MLILLSITKKIGLFQPLSAVTKRLVSLFIILYLSVNNRKTVSQRRKPIYHKYIIELIDREKKKLFVIVSNGKNIVG